MTHLNRFACLSAAVFGVALAEAPRTVPVPAANGEVAKLIGGVMDTWQEAARMADSGESTTAQRTALEAKILEAKKSLDALVAQKRLAPESPAIVANELDILWKLALRNPPRDSMVTCHKMAFYSESRKSLDRLASRAPLLEAAVKSGKMDMPVVVVVVEAIQADLAELAKPDAGTSLTAEQKVQAEKLTTQARKLIAEALPNQKRT